MNERIQELAKQAGFQYIKDEGIGWAGNYNASLPKFAELIVRECVDILDQMPVYYKSEKDRQIERDTIFDCIRTIEQHFGVE